MRSILRRSHSIYLLSFPSIRRTCSLLYSSTFAAALIHPFQPCTHSAAPIHCLIPPLPLFLPVILSSYSTIIAPHRFVASTLCPVVSPPTVAPIVAPRHSPLFVSMHALPYLSTIHPRTAAPIIDTILFALLCPGSLSCLSLLRHLFRAGVLPVVLVYICPDQSQDTPVICFCCYSYAAIAVFHNSLLFSALCFNIVLIC